MGGCTGPCAPVVQWPMRLEIRPHPLQPCAWRGGCPLFGLASPRGVQSGGACPDTLPGLDPLPGSPSLPAPRGRTLLEAEMGHPLDGRVSLLHELVEADQEGLLLLPLLVLLPLPACLGGVLGKEQEALG